MLPCIESYTKVDLRTVSFDVPPQEVGVPMLLFTMSVSNRFHLSSRWFFSVKSNSILDRVRLNNILHFKKWLSIVRHWSTIPHIKIVRSLDHYLTISINIFIDKVLTKDSVTVSVDAVVYYRVSNATVSVANVENAHHSTRLLAQTTLRFENLINYQYLITIDGKHLQWWHCYREFT